MPNTKTMQFNVYIFCLFITYQTNLTNKIIKYVKILLGWGGAIKQICKSQVGVGPLKLIILSHNF